MWKKHEKEEQGRRDKEEQDKEDADMDNEEDGEGDGEKWDWTDDPAAIMVVRRDGHYTVGEHRKRRYL